jgi:hypothetical protein
LWNSRSMARDAAESHMARATLFPIFGRQGMVITELLFGAMLPWHSPTWFGARAHWADDPQGQMAVVTFEWPVPHLAVMGDELSKDMIERLHLERYGTDCLFATGASPYQTLTQGGNPPDFTATMQDGSTVAVDATQLTASGRIAAQAQFERIRRAVLAEPRDKFAHLRGHMLYLWFPTDAGLGLPHRADGAVIEIIEALCAYRPDTSWTDLPPIVEEMPARLGETDMQTTDSGCTFYAAKFLEAVPSTMFLQRTGFEMALAFQTEHKIDSAWTELARLVERHDKPEIQHLVVTVGGPNRRGLVYPSEEALMHLALATGLPELAPRHISSVVLHAWGSGQLIRVHPAPVVQTPVLYSGGYVVPHFSLRPPPTMVPMVDANDETD